MSVQLHNTAAAEVRLDHTISITWSDGVNTHVDFPPFFDRGGWFSPLRDPDYFIASMIILPGGAGLTWPEEISYPSDLFRQEAFPFGHQP